MSIVAVVVALLLIALAFKVMGGLIKFGVIALIAVITIYLLSTGSLG